MNNVFMPAAIILAAGYSSRMGAFKPLLPIDGLPALTHVIRNLKKAGIDNIGVVTGFEREKLVSVIESEGAAEIYNADFDKGMFSSILAGIRHLTLNSHVPSGALLLPVDCPLVPPELMKTILDHARVDGGRFIVPCYKGKKGHPLWIPFVVFSEILAHDGNMGLKGITSRHESEFLRLDVADESVILDMDTPEGYDKLLSFHSKGYNLDDIYRLVKGRRLILVRHGRTARHTEKIFLGQYDPPLDEFGIEQIRNTADELLKLDIQTDTIYTSDLKRAFQSAELVGQRLNIDRINQNDTLREMSLGAWDGRFMSDIKREFPDEFEKRGKSLLTYKIDNESENFYDLQYRVLGGVCDILRRDLSTDILMVTHSGVIRVLYGCLNGHDIKWALSEYTAPGNASIEIIDKRKEN